PAHDKRLVSTERADSCEAPSAVCCGFPVGAELAPPAIVPRIDRNGRTKVRPYDSYTGTRLTPAHDRFVHARHAGLRGLDCFLRVFVVLELALKVGVVRGHVEVTVPAQVEQDHPLLTGFLRFERFLDRGADGVRALRRGDDPLGPRELDRRLE